MPRRWLRRAKRFAFARKKCLGCGKEFRCDTARHKFVIAHKRRFYVRVNDTKHILTIPRDLFYHCDSVCIQIRYLYFYMRCVTVHPAIMRELNDNNAERLLLLGIKLFFVKTYVTNIAPFACLYSLHSQLIHGIYRNLLTYLFRL